MLQIYTIIIYFLITLLVLFVLIYIIFRVRFVQPTCNGTTIRRSHTKVNQDVNDEYLPLFGVRRRPVNCFGKCWNLLWKPKHREEGFFLRDATRIKYGEESYAASNKFDDNNSISKQVPVKNICCSICLEEFHMNEEIISLSCSHGFHESCIYDFAKSKRRHRESILRCPLCTRKTQFTYLGDDTVLLVDSVARSYPYMNFSVAVRTTTGL